MKRSGFLVQDVLTISTHTFPRFSSMCGVCCWRGWTMVSGKIYLKTLCENIILLSVDFYSPRLRSAFNVHCQRITFDKDTNHKGIEILIEYEGAKSTQWGNDFLGDDSLDCCGEWPIFTCACASSNCCPLRTHRSSTVHKLLLLRFHVHGLQCL